MALSQRQVNKICKDLERWQAESKRKPYREKDPKYRAPDREKLTESEAEFLALADSKGGKTYRAGWPDFMVELPDRTIAVEVKSGTDTIREHQSAMFAALERAGLDVYVWHPSKPRALTPWRQYDCGRNARIQN